MATSIKSTQFLLGTWSTLDYDGERVGECEQFKASLDADVEQVAVGGALTKVPVITGLSGNGSMTNYKLSSRFVSKHAAALRRGEILPGTFTSTTTNKSTGAQERVQVSGVAFASVILAEWQVGQIIKQAVNFTFSDYALLDEIEDGVPLDEIGD